ncbi:MAG: response regulator [Eubacteriales bacterium]|nr:response regulator [Eubacteriales bacterium]MDD3289463.1 response regulator [Eubacteriales bacterium]MDD3863233.1 response regulator [Eubacteriales bacterium]
MSKILIVDDAAFMRMMIKDNLKKAGYTECTEASDGEDAVAKYKESAPDLILLDITMPKMDGIQALKEIKQLNPNAKVVMCSAMGQEGMVVEAIKLGAMDFIVKPFKPDRLIQAVKNILGDQ